MNTIWKYELKLTEVQSVYIPRTSKILSVQFQNDKLYLWVIVDNTMNKSDRAIAIIGTGNDCWCSNWNYIGTVQHNEATWHVFSEY